MWFRNLVFYRLVRPFELDPEALERRLAEAAYHPCRAQEQSRSGWSSPLGRQSDQLVHAAQGRMLICLKTEEKILPSTVVKDRLDARIQEIEQAEDRKVRKKERDALREEILTDLLPRAFSRYRDTYALIDPGNNLVAVDASSARRAEDLCSILRKTLGSLPIAIPAVHAVTTDRMTAWLSDDSPLGDGFVLGAEAELKEPAEDGGIVRCRNQPLVSDEIRAHIEAGKQVHRIALHWRDRLSFVLGEDLILRRLKFADKLLDEASDLGRGDPAALFDADFCLMSETLAELIPQLLELLGGENADAYSAISSSSGAV